MSPIPKATTAAERYDAVRRRSRDRRLPPGYPTPQPTAAWPAENVALLERYREWLLSGGASEQQTCLLYVPMAGNALGLNLKPHPEIDIDADLERGLDYVKAKRLSAEWIDMCRVALEKFRRFLRQERGLPPSPPRPTDLTLQQEGLPAWLVEQLTRYQHVMQRNWRPARLDAQIRRFWSSHARLWRWLVTERGVREFRDLRRKYVLDYVDHRLAAGYAVSGINHDLRCLYGLLCFLQDQGFEIPQVLFRLPSLKQPDSLPKFLTDEQVCLLRQQMEAQVAEAANPAQKRDALLDRAAFYLLWQGGLRLGELEELQLEDLDLPGRRLTMRTGKGQRDRTVYLTDTAVAAVRDYLPRRGMGPTDHLFLYRNEPLCKDLVRARIKAAGKRVGVQVYPHRLRHTCATQLLNAGCRVTSIQKFLGHKRLNSTMIYARVHDRTVAEDYYAAMEVVEKRLEVASPEMEDNAEAPVNDHERAHLLALATQLAEPDLSVQRRQDLVDRMCHVLNHRIPPEQMQPVQKENGRRPRAPP
jgi:site-specific recombinase XerD